MIQHFLVCLIAGFLMTFSRWFKHKDAPEDPNYPKWKRNRIGISSNHEKITGKEFALSALCNIGVAIFSMIFFFIYLTTQASDFEIWNGQVVNKERNEVSCSHSYDCPPCKKVCTKRSDGSKSCHKECSTCYKHDYDVDWDVFTTVGTFTISRGAGNEQGLRPPRDWKNAQIGDPAASEHGYENFLLIGDDSLTFKSESLEERYAAIIHGYPEVYSYYSYNRVLNTTKAGTSWLNDKVSKWLSTKGNQKQLNIIYILTEESPDYFVATMSKWAGGKKNDLIIMVGMDQSGKEILWFNANTYAKGMNNRELITELKFMSVGKPFTPQLVDAHLAMIDEKFVRLPAETFAKKKSEVQIPLWFSLIMATLNLLASYGVSRYMREVNL
jgi:hypothetical protein